MEDNILLANTEHNNEKRSVTSPLVSFVIVFNLFHCLSVVLWPEEGDFGPENVHCVV